jgi:hypothetical protein
MAPFPIPREISPAVLEQSPEPCFVVDESLFIVYCNSAWDRFALANAAPPEILGERVVSRNLLDFIGGDLKPFYTDLFARARRSGQPVSHDYECSSAGVFRLYRMQVFPLASSFAVVNSLRLEHPHTRQALAPDDTLYRSKNGLVCMCANCRRTNQAANPQAWDWVPAYLEDRKAKVTHGLCPPCMEFYYHPYLASRRSYE